MEAVATAILEALAKIFGKFLMFMAISLGFWGAIGLVVLLLCALALHWACKR